MIKIEVEHTEKRTVTWEDIEKVVDQTVWDDVDGYVANKLFGSAQMVSMFENVFGGEFEDS